MLVNGFCVFPDLFFFFVALDFSNAPLETRADSAYIDFLE